MCGIAGILDWRTSINDASLDPLVQAMVGAMIHRGPDIQKTAALPPAVLGHARLSIIDLDHAADQPMTLENEGISIVYNGEVYNFMDLRRELEAAGVRFRTHSDTEVVLHAYRRWGTDCFSRFNGMFALGIWDARRRRLLLARDRVGKKPLFFRRLAGGGCVFASTLSALRLHPAVGRKVEPKAVGHFLSLNYTLTHTCMLAGVEKLPAGHFALFEEDRTHAPTSYWDLASCFRRKRHFRNEEDAAEELSALIDDAVRLRLVSDVPLGAFLSGGIDSSLVVAAMVPHLTAERTKTFTIGFSEKSYSELPEAKFVADLFGVDHRDEIVDADMARILPELVRLSDEPFADNSIIPLYYLSKFARESVTVCLSGDGGDELFAGYETYVADRLHHWLSWIPRPLVEGFDAVARRVLPVSFDKVSFDYKLRRFAAGQRLPAARAHYWWRTIFSEAEKRDLVRPEVVAEVLADDPFLTFERYDSELADCHYLDRAMYVDIKTWLVDDILVKADRASMANSLELRAPLLDYRVMEFAASLPVDLKLKRLTKKYILKESQKHRLPPQVLFQKKRGFNAPVAHWLAGALGKQAREWTLSERMGEWLDRSYVETLWSRHEAGLQDNSYKLLGLSCLGLWLEEL